MPSRRGFIQTNLFGLGLLAGRAALPAVFSPNTETIPSYHLSTTSMTAGPGPVNPPAHARCKHC